jgi:hypothetical protein
MPWLICGGESEIRTLTCSIPHVCVHRTSFCRACSKTHEPKKYFVRLIHLLLQDIFLVWGVSRSP